MTGEAGPKNRIDIAAAYDAVACRYLSQRARFDNQAQFGELAGRLPPPASILDVGCGAGDPVAASLVSLGYSVHGVDVSPVQIAMAKERVPDAAFAVLDIQDAEAGQFEVDGVVAFYSIYHIERERHLRVYRLMRSFLRSYGSLFLHLAARELDAHEADFHGVRMRWSSYPPAQELDLLTLAGFRIDSVEPELSGGITT